MFGFLKRLFGRKREPGYRCDGCGQWTPRSKSKAAVEVKRIGVYLRCPDCEELRRYAAEQAAKMGVRRAS
jgi:ssDNA-binding Zn-finger/Zn-ribbon topoisomerase 1